MPRAILLATDLSSRCDRALDRAVFLALQWNARLVALTVIESRAEDRIDPSSAQRHLDARDLVLRDIASSDARLEVDVVVREGDVSENIGAVAADTGCSLIITGTARNEFFGRIVLGSTVDRLSRISPLPLLTVHRRVHGSYARIVVASDFSCSSRHALATIIGLIPDARPNLFHVFDVPFLGLMDNQRDEIVARARSDAMADAQQFLRDAGHPNLPVVLAQGDPATRMREHAEAQDLDLIVMGSHGRTALYAVLIGSVAQRIVETASCDTLLVPEPQARTGH